MYEKRSISDAIAYLHVTCSSPVKDTLIKATAPGNFSGWPGLSVSIVRKYLAKVETTVKGHINQQRQNTRSTQTRGPDTAPALEPTYTGKTEFVYATIVDSGQTNSDLTGRFPTTSAKGNKYVLVLYDYDTNNVLTEPMKIRGDQEMVRAYNKLIQELVDHGLNQDCNASTTNVHRTSAHSLTNMTSNSSWRHPICIAVTLPNEQSKRSKITSLLAFSQLTLIYLSASATGSFRRQHYLSTCCANQVSIRKSLHMPSSVAILISTKHQWPRQARVS
jgi:hypothetical protein